MFKNSSAETKSETEKAFNLSFISMYSALFTAMNFVSFVIIGIILLVLANTMAMTARERTTEYAVLKTLGFTTSIWRSSSPVNRFLLLLRAASLDY